MKRQSLLLSMALIAAFVLSTLVPGCSFDQSNDPTTSSSATIKTALAGQVVDENGKPVLGATVSAYGKSITTTSYGTFLLSDVDVPKERCLIKVSKNGFFNAFRAEEPKANSITHVRIGLMSNAPQGSFAATAGKNVTLPSNASVALPANGYVTENGTAYSGQVRYAIRHLDPASPNFYDFFAGDFQGRASDGSVTNMLSYGVLRVELSGSNGEKLNLGNGAKATLTVPVSPSMKSSAPTSMPLWSFDEAIGMWKEESVATKNGDVYTGTVSHFSEWNFDAKTDPATLVIRVHCGGEIVPNLIVNVGQRTVTSDNELIRIRNVQGGVPIAIKVYAKDNNGIESAEQVVTLVANEVKNIDLPLTTCPALISGSLENCESQKTNGTIVGDYADGSSFYGFARNGEFKIQVKTAATMTIKAIADNGYESDIVSVPALASSQVYPVGTVLACKGNAIVTHDYDLGVGDFECNNLHSVLSKDGSKLITAFHGRKIRIWNTSDGSLINEVPLDNTVGRDSIVGCMDISDDASILLVSTSYSTFYTYNLSTNQKMATFNNVYAAYLSPDGLKVITLTYKDNKAAVELFHATDGTIMRTYRSVNGKAVGVNTYLTDFLTNDQFAFILRESNNALNSLYTLKVSDGSIVSETNVGYSLFQATSPDGSVIALYDSQNNKVNFYSTQNGEQLSSLSFSEKEFDYSNPFAISPDNRRFVRQLYMNRKFSSPALYTISNGILNTALPSPGTDIGFCSFGFSANGKKLAGVYKDLSNTHWKVRIWEL